MALTGVTGTGCSSLTRSQKGAAIGAGAGATVGAFIGKTAGNPALGAIIGGAVGGTAGEYIGRKMDNQAAEIRHNVPGAIVTREGDGIVVRFNSGILFGADSAGLKPEAETNLKNLAASLKNHPGTDIAIIGHTDSTGSTSHNIALSVSRAGAVKSFLLANGIRQSRLIAQGGGATNPVASNATASGRAQNRRVEIIIEAGSELKKE